MMGVGSTHGCVCQRPGTTSKGLPWSPHLLAEHSNTHLPPQGLSVQSPRFPFMVGLSPFLGFMQPIGHGKPDNGLAVASKPWAPLGFQA